MLCTTVRKATFWDAKAIVPLLRRYWEEMPPEVRSSEFDADLLEQRILMHTVNPECCSFVAVSSDGEIVGVFGALLSVQQLWCSEPVAIDVLHYILPEYRGGAIASRFLREYESWSRSKGCCYVYLSAESGLRHDRTERFYIRKGYSPSGFQVRKDL